ncbi:MAG: hypothetical protein U7126_19515 [Microcoleus sp.]
MSDRQDIEQLKERVKALETIIRSYGLMQENQPIKLAAIALGQSESKLRKMVNAARLNPRNHCIKAGIHYSFNGNRILINVVAWQNFTGKSLAVAFLQACSKSRLLMCLWYLSKWIWSECPIHRATIAGSIPSTEPLTA